VRDGLFEGDFSVRLCVREFLKTLPLVLVTGLLWVPILKFLRSCGLPIEVEMQPLMQLLLKGQASVPSLVAIGCSAVVLAPICEEFFFRGILFRFFCSFLSVPKSLWLSSFIVAAMHGSWFAFLPIAAVGYRLGRSYAESRNLAVNMTIHGLFNAFNFIMAVTYAHCYAA
jgi:membrane protease YdiL (CAAX protease family)